MGNSRSHQWKAVLLLLALVWQSASFAQQGTPAASVKCNRTDLPQLVDVAAKSGITFQHTSAADKRYIVESMSGGVLLLDYDRDGWLDIYFTNAQTVAMALAGKKAKSALYHNNHDGTFTDVTDKAGVGYPCWAFGGAVGDYNNDGWPDIYVTCLGKNVLYRNNGDGTFTDVTDQAGVGDARWSMGASFGDYDGDGFVDLMVTNYVDFRLEDLPGFGKKPTCQYKGIDVQCGPRGLKGAGDTLYHNNGDGTFTDVSKKAGVSDPNGYYGLTAIFTDLDGDGKPDIYVANDATPNYLYRNNGDGTFTDLGVESSTALSEDGAEQASMGVAIGDFVHTGRSSLYVTNFSDEYSAFYRNEGKFNFKDVSYASKTAVPSFPYVKWGTFFFDLENSGWLDLFAVNGHVYPQVDTLPSGAKYREPKNLFLNNHDGTFCDAGEEAGAALKIPQVSRGAAYGDLDNDGNIDIVVENLDGSPMILHNIGNKKNHWVTFELAGTKSNRLAIGARVKVVTADMAQMDEVRSGGSYISQSDMRLHFGLGPAMKIDSIEVRWPSGKVEVLKDVAVDRFYGLKEGEGIVPLEQVRPKRENRGQPQGTARTGDGGYNFRGLHSTSD